MAKDSLTSRARHTKIEMDHNKEFRKRVEITREWYRLYLQVTNETKFEVVEFIPKEFDILEASLGIYIVKADDNRELYLCVRDSTNFSTMTENLRVALKDRQPVTVHLLVGTRPYIFTVE